MKITDPNRIGDINELKAVTWLLEQGYEVFRNVGCTGPIDLVAVKPGEVLMIDVKTSKIVEYDGFTYLQPGGYKTKDRERKAKEYGVKLLHVYEGFMAWTKKELTHLLVQAKILSPLNPEHYETV